MATLVAAAAFSIGFLVIGGIWFLSALITALPNQSAIDRIGDMNQATAIYDRGDQLAFTIYKEQRIDVPLSNISPHLIHAIIAVEDQRFYDHRGFDLVRIASAAIENVRRHRAAQGGSTLTQQLARQAFLTPAKTYRRKLQELILAARLERMYSKDEILDMYLNKVYFGDGLYGAEAASRGYFSKHAADLTIDEAALLAGLVKSPSVYAPTVNPARAKARRNVVLQAMLDARAIDRPTFERARASGITLHDGLHNDDPFGQYFKEQVRLELLQRFGWQRVYQGGLRVYSTLDTGMQHAAEDAVASGLTALDQRRTALKPAPKDVKAAKNVKAANTVKPANKDEKAPPPPPPAPLQAALVAMDPVTGEVRAMVGGRDFGQSHFNRAVQAKRQPGSAFKPFVYAAALESGYTPASVIQNLNVPIATLQGAWTPEEGHAGGDAMSIRTALRTSSNRAAVRLLQDIGIYRAVAYAKSMGVGDVPSVPSLALGSGEVTLQSLTAAYAAFANHGFVPRATVIRRVEDRDGTVLYAAQDTPKRAINDTTAFLMSNMMADVVNAGTAAGIRRLGFTLPAAGKTGTTNDFNDAWFVGFTPSLVAGVWVGFDRPQTILPRGFAADVAVPVWASFMKVATKGAKPDWLPQPPGIVSANICRISGKLASPECADADVVGDDGTVQRRSMVYTEYFTNGTQPTEYCHAHEPHIAVDAVAMLPGQQQPPPPPATNPAPGLPAPAPPAPPSQPAAAAAAAVVGTTIPVAVGTAGTQLPPPAPPDDRGGFWSRVFRRTPKTETTTTK